METYFSNMAMDILIQELLVDLMESGKTANFQTKTKREALLPTNITH